jgi:hypothetical protein
MHIRGCVMWLFEAQTVETTLFSILASGRLAPVGLTFLFLLGCFLFSTAVKTVSCILTT